MALLHKGQLQAFAADRRAATRMALSARPCTRVVTSSHGRVNSRIVCGVAKTENYKGDLMNRSYYPTSADASNSSKRWYVIDAEGQTLGRLATLAATYIRGKHLPTYTPSMDMGAFVVVINAEKVTVSGTKFDDKTYFRHPTGRPGSSKFETFKDLQKRLPERIIEHAVKGMLPKGAIGRNIRLHLKVFKGTAHTHEAQQPTNITGEISIKPKCGAGAKLREELKKKL